MERVLSNTRKVLVNDRGNNLMVLPLDQLMRSAQSTGSSNDQQGAGLLKLPTESGNSASRNSSSSYNPASIMDQRRANALRNDTQREGRE